MNRCQVCGRRILDDEITCDGCADELEDDGEDDGQPSEADEWRDYDPDC